MSELSKQALKVDNNTSFPNNTTNYITPAILRAFNVNVIESVVVEEAYQPFTQSVLQSLDSLDAFTASLNTSLDALDAFTASAQISINALNANTQSVNNSVDLINAYTASNDTKWSNLGSQSGSWVTESETGSFAKLDGTQTFTGVNTFSNEMTASAAKFLSIQTGTLTATTIHTITESSSVIYSSGSNIFGDAPSDTQTLNGTVRITGSQQITGSASATGNGLFGDYTLNQYPQLQTKVSTTTNPGNIYSVVGISNDGDSVGSAGIYTSTFTSFGSGLVTGIFGGLGGNKFAGDGGNTAIYLHDAVMEIVKDTKVSGSLEVSSSLSVNGSPVVVSSQTGSFIINTGSFATTGSNVFTGDQILSDATSNTATIQSYSGSFVLTSKGIASGSSTLAHVTSSTSQVNFMFKGSAATGETVISGSNNLFANQGTPTTGFRKYITNGNIGLAGTALPQFSSSMAFSPTVNSNYFANSTSNIMTVRGPVSSSTWNINNNGIFGGTVSLGTSATLTFEKAVNGTTLANNVINGTVNATAYKTSFIANAAMTISSNNLGGAINLNADSSSITLANSTIQNAAFTVNNSYYNPSATGGGNSLTIQQGNGIFGANTLIYASGSNTTAANGRQFIANFVAGTFNSASLHLNGDNSNIQATAIIGHNLVVTGSSALQTGAVARNNTYGSAFFGRFNAQDGNKAGTAETVFAVGTGTTTTPKTGFLIDSGSNTFIEGSLNVSGSTTITGSLSVTNLIVSGSTQFNVGAFNSTITQSGSAAVSQSMTFNNTDITQGVSVVDTTKLTIANSGTYNIQFSAQLLADTGADTIWIWLKQNGTNVSNTATKLALANNEADVAAWNFVVPATANDYFELVWQNNGGHAKILAETASGNYPAIPSVIATVTQVR